MTDWILGSYSEKYRIGCLSRGYKRSTQGFVLADSQSKVQDLGDESFQLFRRWGARICLAVDANRVEGVKKLALHFPDLDWVVLDDAFQHRAICPDLSILLTSEAKPFYENQVLPAGTLRDVPQAAFRARMVVFTKAEELSEARLSEKKQELNRRFPEWNPAVFLSGIAYHSARNLHGNSLKAGSVVVCVAGLANNSLFFAHCQEEFLVEKFISRPDHSRYLPGFFQEHQLEEKIILCTEKDVYKLLEVAPKPENVFYIPLSISLYPEAEFRAVFESHLP
jgi:tetraacyldisaccharide 4'-kinase